MSTIASESRTHQPTADELLGNGDGTRFPSPQSGDGRDVVIFDGQCVFCRTGVKQLRRLDIGGKKLSYISLHDFRVAEIVPELSHDELMQQMYVVQANGARHGGAEAVRYLSRRLPILWWALPVLHLPGTANLWRTLYSKVASARYRIMGRDDCESGTCQIGTKR